MSIYDTVVKL